MRVFKSGVAVPRRLLFGVAVLSIAVSFCAFTPAASAEQVVVGSRVEVYYGGQWFPAVVTEVHGGSVRARFTDERSYPSELNELLMPIFMRTPEGGEVSLTPADLDDTPPGSVPATDRPDLRVGAQVEVYYAGLWLPATVKALSTGGGVLAAFTDERQYPPQAEEWFQPIFIRAPLGQTVEGQAAPAPSAQPDSAAIPPVAAAPDHSAAPQEPSAAATTDMTGDWAFHIPGQAWISTRVTEDWSVRIETTTHTLHSGAGARSAGAARIRPDGTYRMVYLDEAWEGRWRTDAGTRGGIVLEYPGDRMKDWALFVADDGQPRALCATCTGESYNELERIDASLAERLVAEWDPSEAHGTWALRFREWDSGSIEIRADGTFRLRTDEVQSSGRWEAQGRKIRLVAAFGHDGWYHFNSATPDLASLTGSSVELAAVRR